jgi:hypothetical protein
VHAVGDRADRHLVDGHVGPQPGEHLAADLPVQLGDAVGAATEPQAHDGHVELVVGLVVAVPRLISVSKVVPHDGGEGAEVLFHQLALEAVDAGRHGRVRGEHAAGAHGLDGLANVSRVLATRARGCARATGSRRGLRWCGTPAAAGRAPAARARRRCPAPSPGAGGARRRRRTAVGDGGPSGLLPSTLVSSRYSFMRPTCTCHAAPAPVSPAISRSPARRWSVHRQAAIVSSGG